MKTAPVDQRHLIESMPVIPWKIDWRTKRFTYIGPQVERLLGWPLESWSTVQDWADKIHQDDRDRVVDFCLAQSVAGNDHEAEYRALKKDGDYVRIRDIVHVERNRYGEVESMMGFMLEVGKVEMASLMRPGTRSISPEEQSTMRK